MIVLTMPGRVCDAISPIAAIGSPRVSRVRAGGAVATAPDGGGGGGGAKPVDVAVADAVRRGARVVASSTGGRTIISAAAGPEGVGAGALQLSQNRVPRFSAPHEGHSNPCAAWGRTSLIGQ